MYKYIRNIGFAVASLGLILTSCGDDYPKSKEAPYDNEIISIKVMNAGADGNTVLEGTINRSQNVIDFPRMDPATNFAALRVEAKLPEGAELSENVLNFSMDEEDAEQTLTIKVINHKRYKEYLMKVRKRVPVFGADFAMPTVYNFSGDNIYLDYKTAGYTRCAAFDGEHVLIVTRTTSGPHLLKFSDLKNGEVKPIKLNLTGVAGGTYPYNMGALANKHVYIATLSGSQASPLKIYYWETPTSTPEVIADINVSTIPGAGVRHGDNFSLNIDKNGNGYIYFGDNASTKILRFTISNHKTIGAPAVFPSNPDVTAFMNINGIEGTSQYVWSGVRTPVMLTDESVTVKYSMNKNNLGTQVGAPRIFTFNEERYLLLCSSIWTGIAGVPSMYVYNITKGTTVEDALRRFDNGQNHNPDYTYILGGTGNGNPAVQTNYYIEQDEQGNDSKLYIFGSRTDSGFAICEFPIKHEEED